MLTLTLTSTQESFLLSKDWIRSNLPGSVLNSALQDDPEVTELSLSHPDVTSKSLQVIVDLSKGIEPDKHVPSLALAHRYLNIPGLLYYTDPLYDQIPIRNDITSALNKFAFDTAIKSNHSLIVGYYLVKGLIPTDAMFIEAVRAGSTNVVQLLLPYIKSTFERNYALIDAVRLGHTTIVRMLLTDPGFVDLGIDGFTLVKAAELGHTEIAQLLLTKGQIDPNTYFGRPLQGACRYGQTDVAKILLTDPRTSFTYEPMAAAAREGHVKIIEAFLVHPKIEAFAIKSAYDTAITYEQDDVVAVIKADPRYQSAWEEDIFYRMRIPH